MATTLPQVNFGFDELKDRMARFTVNFDEFIDKGRKRIEDERNEFAKNVVEDKGFFHSSTVISRLMQILPSRHTTDVEKGN